MNVEPKPIESTLAITPEAKALVEEIKKEREISVQSGPEDNKPTVGQRMVIEGRLCIWDGKSWTDALEIMEALIITEMLKAACTTMGRMDGNLSRNETELVISACRTIEKKFKRAIR